MQTLGNRLLVAAAAAPALFFVPWALLSPVIAGGGALSGCRPACPANVLQVGSAPGAVEFLGRWESYAMLALVIVVIGVYWRRVATASRPQRRALIAVAASSLLFLPIFFVYHFSSVDPARGPEHAGIGCRGCCVGSRVLLPLGFLVALIQAQLFAGAVHADGCSSNCWRALRRGSGAARSRWRSMTRRCASGTGILRPGVTARPTGASSSRRTPAAGARCVESRRGGQPVAAMIIDDALAEDPELVRAATSATVLAVENGNLEGQLRASRDRVREVGAAERKRIQANLHDSAQQRLVALRIRLALTSERLHGPEQRRAATLRRRGRSGPRGGAYGGQGDAPSELARHGVAAALDSLARSGVMPVTIEDRGFGRRSELVETTVFFCCAEALQNATKHAGASTSASVLLSHSDGWVRFSVEDDGAGFDPHTVARGHGLKT